MARRNPIHQDNAEEDVNVTPLLDIVFIMLIFFIVTSTFVKEPGVEVERPEATTWDEQRLAKIIVAISATDEIWINKKQVGLAEVRTEVEKLHVENPRGTAVVQADVGAKSRLLVEVLNQIRDAGISEVAVSTLEA